MVKILTQDNMGRKIRLTESTLRAMVNESVRRVLSEIVGPSDRYSRNVSAKYAASKSHLDSKADSFHSMSKEYIRRGLEKSHLRDRWNAKYSEIGKMDVFGNIDLTDEWKERLGETFLNVSWFSHAPEDYDISLNNEYIRKLAMWDSENALPKGAINLLAKAQDYI